MRLLIEMTTDDAGRPVGQIRIDDETRPEPFADWLDLLRLLEACVEHASPASSTPEPDNDKEIRP